MQSTFRKVYLRKQGKAEITFLQTYKHPIFIKLLYYAADYKWAIFEEGEFTFHSPKLEMFYQKLEVLKWLDFAQISLQELKLYHNDLHERNIVCFPHKPFPYNFKLIDFELSGLTPSQITPDYYSFTSLKEQVEFRYANRKPLG